MTPALPFVLNRQCSPGEGSSHSIARQSSPATSTAAASFISSFTVATPTSQEAEEYLFSRFPGWTYSERTGLATHWIWKEGYDLTNHTVHQPIPGKVKTTAWICKRCVLQRASHLNPYVSKGTGGIMNHLFKQHSVRAPLVG